MSESVPGPKLTYGAVSAALLVPVLIWPVFWWQDGGLDPGLDVGQVWLIAAATTLLIAIAADSVLYYRHDGLSPFFAAGWVLFGSVAVSAALRLDNGPFLIGCLFGGHALRSGWYLWHEDPAWWLWPAWTRDMLAAFGIFAWLALLAHV